jgi:hypothetical protein
VVSRVCSKRAAGPVVYVTTLHAVLFFVHTASAWGTPYCSLGSSHEVSDSNIGTIQSATRSYLHVTSSKSWNQRRGWHGAKRSSVHCSSLACTWQSIWLLTIHRGAFFQFVLIPRCLFQGIAVHPCELIHSARTCGGLESQENVLRALSGWVDEAGDGLVRNLLFPHLYNYVIQRVWPCRCQENTSEISAPDPRSM